MPGPVGANPSLTIAAMAERIAAGMVAHDRDLLPRVARRVRRLRRRRLERGLDRRARGRQPLRDPPRRRDRRHRRASSPTPSTWRAARAGSLRRPRRAASRSRRAGSTCSSTWAARAIATWTTACTPRRRRPADHVRRASRTSTTTRSTTRGPTRRRCFSRLYAGHLEAASDPPDARLAVGVLRVTRVGFARPARSRSARTARAGRALAAKARWGAMFAAGPAARLRRAGPGRPAGLPLAARRDRAVPGLPGRRVARGPRPAGARAADPRRSRAGDGRDADRCTTSGARRPTRRPSAPGPARPRHRRAGEPLLHAAAAHDARRRAPRRRPRRLARELARLDRPRHLLATRSTRSRSTTTRCSSRTVLEETGADHAARRSCTARRRRASRWRRSPGSCRR